MKKFLLLAMTLLMALSLVAGCGSDSPKKMVIGLDDNFAPMGFRNEKNEIVGYDIDLAKEACKRAGMEVEFKPIDWASKEAEIKGKRIDAIWNCFTVNPERQEAYTLSKPYMVNAQLVVVPKGSEITKIADLKGKVLAVQDDSTGSYILDRNNELRTSLKDYRKYPDFAAVYMDMDAGRIDACGTTPDQRVAGDIDERVRVVVAEAEACLACDWRCTSFGAILVDVQIEAQARQASGMPRPHEWKLGEPAQAAPADRQVAFGVRLAALDLQPVFGAAEMNLHRFAGARGAIGGQFGDQHGPVANPLCIHAEPETVAIADAV